MAITPVWSLAAASGESRQPLIVIKFGDHCNLLGREKTTAPSRECVLRNEAQKARLGTKSKINLRSLQRSQRLDQVAKQLEQEWVKRSWLRAGEASAGTGVFEPCICYLSTPIFVAGTIFVLCTACRSSWPAACSPAVAGYRRERHMLTGLLSKASAASG